MPVPLMCYGMHTRINKFKIASFSAFLEWNIYIKYILKFGILKFGRFVTLNNTLIGSSSSGLVYQHYCVIQTKNPQLV